METIKSDLLQPEIHRRSLLLPSRLQFLHLLSLLLRHGLDVSGQAFLKQSWVGSVALFNPWMSLRKQNIDFFLLDPPNDPPSGYLPSHFEDGLFFVRFVVLEPTEDGLQEISMFDSLYEKVKYLDPFLPCFFRFLTGRDFLWPKLYQVQPLNLWENRPGDECVPQPLIRLFGPIV